MELGEEYRREGNETRPTRKKKKTDKKPCEHGRSGDSFSMFRVTEDT